MSDNVSYAPLENPVVWEASRRALDLAFGLYRKRIALLREWAGTDSSLLDVGCGVGSYSAATSGRYMGVDLDERYIRYARQRRGDQRHAFLCADVSELPVDERFDVVLAVDLLHHLTDAGATSLLRAAAPLAERHVILFEPVLEQTTRLGRWFIDHDRGEHMRPRQLLLGLVSQSLAIVREEPLRLGPIDTIALLCTSDAGRS